MRSIALLAASAAALSGCMADRDTIAAPAVYGAGILANVRQESVGMVQIVQGADGPEVSISVSSMAPGRYGIHLHSVGRCDAPAFTSAGPHWNPTGRQHGRLNPLGTHHGDLPNLDIGANGSGLLKVPMIGGLTGAQGLFDADGAALVLHGRADDERTDPSGNSGDRIACAVLSPN